MHILKGLGTTKISTNMFYSQTEENITIPNMTSAEKCLLMTIHTKIMRVNPFIETIRDILDVTGG